MKRQDLVQKGFEHGLLSREALDAPLSRSLHPWPWVVMSFFGALLAALPLLAFVFAFFGRLLEQGFMAYCLGAILIGGACAALRRKESGLFLENLLLVFMMAGLGLVFFALIRDLLEYGSLVSVLLALGIAAWVPVNWMRALLSAIAVIVYYEAPHSHLLAILSLGHVLVLVWLGGLWVQQRLLASSERIKFALALEWILSGWIVALLAFNITPYFTLWSHSGATLGRRAFLFSFSFPALISALYCLGGAIWACRRWPGLRSSLGIGLLGILTVLSWFIPALGPVVLIGLVLVVTRRIVHAGFAALVAAWLIGVFYYALDWSLVVKAQVLIAAGIVLTGLAWRAFPRLTPGDSRTTRKEVLPLVALGLLATLTVVNFGIWQKEDIIAHGRPVFIKMAPVDPRSLMQGDYMALNFEIPPGVQEQLSTLSRLERPRLVGHIDAKGVLTLERLKHGAPLRNREVEIELSPGKNGWVVVSDAWFFKEGDGMRWSKARYGEFRILPNGRALLVGMADEGLVRISPAGVERRK